MAILQFNGWSVSPEPSECNVTIQDISSSDSGRSSVSATMNKYVVAKKRTIQVAWNNPTQAEAQAIISHLTSAGTYVSVVYDGDPTTTGTRSGSYYYGDISAAYQQCWVAGRKRYSKLNFTLIER